MKFEFKKRNFVCLFPWLTDITAIKCTGQICETIATKYIVNSYIVTYKNEEYPKFQKYCPKTILLFLKGKVKSGGWTNTGDFLRFIIRYAKKIDMLYLYHMQTDYLQIPMVGYLYKMLNSKGTLYVRFETDIDTLPLNYPDINEKGFINLGKNFLKNHVIKKFYSSINILGVGDNNTFDLSRKRHFWKLAGDKLRIQLNGYRLYEEPVVTDFKNKEKIILLAGRLNSCQKGLDVFLKALKEINLNDWKVILAGEIMQDQINEIYKIEEENHSLKGKIEILGFLDNVTVYSRLLNNSRIFCLPSRYDGIPLVIPDAMARGCVIVGSDLFGIKEIATDNGNCGFYFPNGDSKALAKILNDIISGSYDLEEISIKSRKRAEEIFKWDKIVEGLQIEKYFPK